MSEWWGVWRWWVNVVLGVLAVALAAAAILVWWTFVPEMVIVD